jgi:hypothetical protein
VLQRVSSILIAVFAIGVVVTGLNGFDFIAQAIEGAIPFEYHRVLDVFLVSAIAIHVGVGIRFFMMRKRWTFPHPGKLVAVLVLSLLVVTASLNPIGFQDLPVRRSGTAEAWIDGNSYTFNLSEVETVRPDLFKPGSFSMFDVLVNLAEQDLVELEYYYDASMNTHVIDSLEGESSWWYQVTFSGGWSERNVFRMDHYPWKEDTELVFYKPDSSFINGIFETFREEVTRLEENGGEVIIPEVLISGGRISMHLEDVVVTPHNLRSDVFQDGVITAIDVIISLADQGNLTYELKWYDSIGDASVVRSYWVDTINGKDSYGTCGWVYESGSWTFRGFIGNHIHLPSDVRILNSPEYVEWFWICI